MNKVILIGRLTRDPEMRYSTNNNTAVARYTLAVNRQFKQEGGQEADFLPCVAFGKTAEFAEKYLFKGIRVAIEGKIQTGNYTNREGQKVYTTEIAVERQEFLEKKADNSQPADGDAESRWKGVLGSMDIPDGMEDEDYPFN